MRLNRPEVHVTMLASRLGARVSIRDLDDAQVRENLSALEEQGLASARVATVSTAALALAVTPGTPSGPLSGTPFQVAVVCTDSAGDAKDRVPTGWLVDFRQAAALSSVQAILVSGSACANFATGLDVSRGLIAAGAADSVLLVTADRVLSGTRYPEISTTVYSDGSASCLVTADPGRVSSFRLLGSATETWLSEKDGWGGLADARVIVSATRSATSRVTNGLIDHYRHLVTPNFGRATRELLAMAAAMPSGRLYSRLVPEVGHCFAADIPLNMQDLEQSGQLADGDKILAVASSRHTLSALAFEYRSQSDISGSLS